MKKLDIKKPDLIVGLLAAALFIGLSFGGLSIFEYLERIFYGAEMRLDLPQNPGGNRIAILNIDEKSLKQLGPWPWPRYLIADMVSILKNNGARLIGIDLIFADKEQNQGLNEIKSLQEGILKRETIAAKDAWLMDTLKSIERRLDNDGILSQKVKDSGNIILPVMGHFGSYDTEEVLDSDSFLQKHAMNINGLKANDHHFVSVNELTAPFEELSKNSMGLGHINMSPNRYMKDRVHLLFIDYRGHVIPSMPFLIALDYLNKKPQDIIIGEKGIQLSGFQIPAVNGEIFIKYKGGRRSFPYYSFVDILKVKKVPAVFDNKIVLIGYTAEGGESINTPVDPQMPRVELTANIIDNLLNAQYLKRPYTVIYIEGFLLLLISLFASTALPGLNLLNRVAATAGMIFVTFLIGVLCFIFLDTWFKIIYISLALASIFVFNGIKDIVIKQRSLGLTSKESIETNRMLGLSLQSQGLLDLAFEKFRKCPLDDAMKDVVYNLGLDYERKRMVNKAISVYEYITRYDRNFRELNDRIPKLKKLINPFASGSFDRKKEDKIVMADDLEVKPTVGRYEVLNELGQGAMGIVYKARDPKIHRLVAIKTIRFSDEFEEEKLKEVKGRFLREAEIAGKLSHPTIVSIYDVGEDYDLTYLAMEFLEGEDLQKYCRKGNLLPLRRILYVVGETAMALDHAHSQGVIHRDIKPGNIMLLKNGKVKVTDFGIAKAVSTSQTRSGIILGTPNYMSPEQINGQEIDGRSDIFSLGVVFFELLTGQLPFRGKNLTNLFYQITQGKHPSPREINPKIPTPCERIIDKALTKDPETRFQKASDLAKYVRALLQKMEQVRANGS